MAATIIAETFDGDDSSPNISFRLQGAPPGTALEDRLSVEVHVNVTTASGQRVEATQLQGLLKNVPGLTAQQKSDLQTGLQALYNAAKSFVEGQVND